MKDITFVTGLWDLKRGEAKEGWNRSFDHYKESFQGLLTELKDHNLIVYVEQELESFVWEHRDRRNTQVVIFPKEKFNSNFFPFYDQIQKIRKNPEWYNRAGWLKDSTQGSLEWYNPMVMSKMFMLHNAHCMNSFNDKYMFWIDGGIKNTCSPGYLNDENVLKNLKRVSSNMSFICFPYETNSEIHGFAIEGMRQYAENKNVNRVARGGFFGGNRERFQEANGLYYDLLARSLDEGLMGTEESIFTIMTYLEPVKYRYRMIEGNGLVYKYFEDLKKENFASTNKKKNNLYIITYNAPNQLQMVLDSFEKHDRNFIDESNLILLNNTIDPKYYPKYEMICDHYGIDERRFNNIGICGGRQWVAEDFAESDAEYMMFFEDDMLLDPVGADDIGFKKEMKNVFQTCMAIMEKEQFDFFKMCFREFYGNNSEQWSWHNLPHDKRDEYFPETSRRPPTKFEWIKSYLGVAYAAGEIYYSNWPQIVTKAGNQKCFLDTKWAHPYEQTWMSHIYQLTRQGIVNPGILLASPFTHNRITHYAAKERKEN